jgi:hypothetical protein
MGNKLTTLVLTLALLLLPLLGCGDPADGRTAEEWLSLAYSGLAAKDQYSFTGSVSMETADGVAFKPQTFEGKIAMHNQLTLQADNRNQPHFNPIQVLEMLRNDQSTVELLKAGRGDDRLTLQIKQKESLSTQRWGQRLREELAAVGGATLTEGSPVRQRALTDELKRSERQLEVMLEGMKATSVYELVIDRSSLLPESIEETTTFNYSYKGRPLSETRHTTVRLQTAEGERGGTVQRLLSRDRMNGNG